MGVSIWERIKLDTGFPGGSDGKESTCNGGDLGLIPCWEDPLEDGIATHSSILAWRIPMDRGAWQVTNLEVTKRQTWLRTKHSAVHDSAIPLLDIYPKGEKIDFKRCMHPYVDHSIIYDSQDMEKT